MQLVKDKIINILAYLSHNGTEYVTANFGVDFNVLHPWAYINEIRYICNGGDYVFSYGRDYQVTDEIQQNPDSVSANLGMLMKRVVEFFVPHTVMSTSCHGNLTINMKELQIGISYQVIHKGLEEVVVDHIGNKYPLVKSLAKSVLGDTVQFLNPDGDFEVIVERGYTHSWKQIIDDAGEVQTVSDYLCLHTDKRVREIFEIAKKYMTEVLAKADKKDGMTTRVTDWCLFIQKQAEKDRTVMTVRFDTEIAEKGKITIDVKDVVDQLV